MKKTLIILVGLTIASLAVTVYFSSTGNPMTHTAFWVCVAFSLSSTLVSIIDIQKSNKSSNQKLLWIVRVILAGAFGVEMYIVEEKKGRRDDSRS